MKEDLEEVTGVDALTEEELEALLNEKRKAKVAAAEKAKKAYETRRELAIGELFGFAEDLAAKVASFKELCHKTMDAQQMELEE